MSVIELRVCGRYRLEGMLNRSHNHCTYTAVNVQTEEEVIIKAEEAKGRRDNPQSLLTEGKILQSLQGGIGIPSMHWYPGCDLGVARRKTITSSSWNSLEGACRSSWGGAEASSP